MVGPVFKVPAVQKRHHPSRFAAEAVFNLALLEIKFQIIEIEYRVHGERTHSLTVQNGFTARATRIIRRGTNDAQPTGARPRSSVTNPKPSLIMEAERTFRRPFRTPSGLTGCPAPEL